jgi:hypothetical protein
MGKRITDIHMHYNREDGRLIVTLDEPYTGSVNVPVTISGVVSAEVQYNYKDAMLRDETGPYFNAMKEKVQDHNAAIG